MHNISTIIPNYNGRTLLQKFLPHVCSTLAENDELIIVDDNSTDDSVKYLIKNYKLKLSKVTTFPTQVSTDYFPQPSEIKYKVYKNTLKANKKEIALLLVVLEKNLRFAGAANTGVLFAKNDYILLLNSDVKPTPSTREKLLRNFTDSSVFGVSCLEFENDITGNKSGKNKLWFSKGIFMHSKAVDMNSGATAWISGGSGMFSKEKWVELNGFDQLYYPAYWEDVDLSYRAKKKGWKVLFDAEAIVYHIHESTNSDVFGQQKIMDMSWKNAISFIKKNANFWQLILFHLYKPYWDYKRNKLITSKTQL